jgi:hypothetical protein
MPCKVRRENHLLNEGIMKAFVKLDDSVVIVIVKDKGVLAAFSGKYICMSRLVQLIPIQD